MPTEALATAERALLEERRPLTRDEVLAAAKPVVLFVDTFNGIFEASRINTMRGDGLDLRIAAFRFC